MFTPEQRAALKSQILEYAAADRRISGAAVTGSGAAGREDRWSDIDLAFGVADGMELSGILADFTAHMYQRHEALHHFDIGAGAWIYRVFLMPGTLQVDLAFVPAREFRPLAPTFRLVFGESKEAQGVRATSTSEIIGFSWLYAVHARSCIARGTFWQAEYMISGARDQALALACIRHGLPAVHGRGVDQLPDAVKARFAGALVRHLDAAELSRAFRVAIDALMEELQYADKSLAGRLHAALKSLPEDLE